LENRAFTPAGDAVDVDARTTPEYIAFEFG
jgi:hypothetical protein